MAVSFDEFAVAWFVSGLNETLPVKVLGFLQGQVSPRINAIGTFVFILSMTLVILAQLLLSGRQLGGQAADLDRVAGGRKIVVEGRAALGHAGKLRPVQTFEEIADVDLEEAGDVPELRCRDAVGALFVLLDLLEGQSERAAQVALVIAQADPLLADPAPHMAIHGVRPVLALASSHLVLSVSAIIAMPRLVRTRSLKTSVSIGVKS